MTSTVPSAKPFAMPAAPARPSAGLLARLIAVPAIWGGTFIAGRLVAGNLPPSVGALLRYLFASVALWVALRAMEGGLPRLSRRQWMVTALLGATGIFGYNLFFFAALERLPASRTSLIIAMNPVVTIALSVLLLGDRLSPRRWAGVAVALAGVWIVVSRGDVTGALSHAVGAGEAMMFAGVCMWAAYTLIGRAALKGLSPLAATTCASLWGTAMLGAVAAFDLGRVPPSAYTFGVLASSAYLGLLGTAVAFVWYYQGVQRLGASRTVVFNNLVPVFGTAFGVTLLGEPLQASMLVGGAVAVAGVFLATWTPATLHANR